jgi:putative endonuclease
VLYVGVTNNLIRRLSEHADEDRSGFANKYLCNNLIYWERFDYIEHAINRETQLKKWNREKKEKLIATINPEWRFLDEEVKG